MKKEDKMDVSVDTTTREQKAEEDENRENGHEGKDKKSKQKKTATASLKGKKSPKGKEKVKEDKEEEEAEEKVQIPVTSASPTSSPPLTTTPTNFIISGLITTDNSTQQNNKRKRRSPSYAMPLPFEASFPILRELTLRKCPNIETLDLSMSLVTNKQLDTLLKCLAENVKANYANVDKSPTQLCSDANKLSGNLEDAAMVFFGPHPPQRGLKTLILRYLLILQAMLFIMILYRLNLIYLKFYLFFTLS